MKINTNIAANAEPGIQSEDFAVVIGERAGEILKADHKL
jgi:hypothetical protein